MLVDQREMSVVCSRSGYLDTIQRNKMQNNVYKLLMYQVRNPK